MRYWIFFGVTKRLFMGSFVYIIGDITHRFFQKEELVGANVLSQLVTGVIHFALYIANEH